MVLEGKKEIFKNELFDLRINNNLSCLKVAVKIGTSENAIDRLERGEQKIILDEHAEKLANLYGVSLEDILSAYKKTSELYEKIKLAKKSTK